MNQGIETLVRGIREAAAIPLIIDRLEQYPLHPTQPLTWQDKIRSGGGYVDQWMADYERKLDYVEDGAREASVHREDIYLGRGFKIIHGEIYPRENGKLAYNLASIRTPNPEVSLRHAMERIITGLNIQLPTQQAGEKDMVHSWVQEVLANNAKASAMERQTNLDISDQWRLHIEIIEVKENDSKIEMLLETRNDEAINGREKARRKETDSARIKEYIRLDKICETPLDIDYDYQASSEWIHTIQEEDAISDEEIAEAVVSTEEWQKIETEKLPAIAQEYPINPQDEGIYAIFKPTREGETRLLVLRRDGKNMMVNVVISNAELAGKKEAFIAEMKPKIEAQIIGLMADANKFGKEVDLSPDQIIKAVIIERSPGLSWLRKAVRDLTPTVAKVFDSDESIPNEVIDFLQDWSYALKYNMSIEIPNIEGIVQFNSDGSREFWSINPSPDDFGFQLLYSRN